MGTWGQWCSSFLGLSLSLAGDELLETDFLDHLADDLILEVEVVDLELGLLGNKVHLSLSFLI